MAKSVFIVKGSPRTNGNSAALADQVYTGAKQSGAEVEAINIAEMDIRPCDACDVLRSKRSILRRWIFAPVMHAMFALKVTAGAS